MSAVGGKVAVAPAPGRASAARSRSSSPAAARASRSPTSTRPAWGRPRRGSAVRSISRRSTSAIATRSRRTRPRWPATSASSIRLTTTPASRSRDRNLWGVIHGTKAFLPHLLASGDGHLINVSSLNGYMAQAEMTHYCASKFAVGFTEAVRAEMLAAGHPVAVSSVHPGGIRTNIANAALETAKGLGLPATEADERRRDTYNAKLLKMDPARAAKIIVDGVEAGRPRILVGNDARVVDALVRLLPSRYPKLAVAFDRRLSR